MQKNFQMPNKVIKKDFTKPPKIIDFRFWDRSVDPYDDDGLDSEFLFWRPIFNKNDALTRNWAKYIFCELQDFDSDEIRNFTVDFLTRPFKLWTRANEEYEIIPEHSNDIITPAPEVIADYAEIGLKNYRITLTPFNQMGEGNSSTFLLPLKNLNYHTFITPNDRAQKIIGNNFDLLFEDPQNISTRSKFIHIYFDVPLDDISQDKELMNSYEYRYTSLSDYKIINSLQYRWALFSDGSSYKLDKLGWKTMPDRDKSFIKDLLRAIGPDYRSFIAKTGVAYNEPHIFKLLIKHPFDWQDSLILYIMKGQRWNL